MRWSGEGARVAPARRCVDRTVKARKVADLVERPGTALCRTVRLRTTTQGREPMPDESGHMWVITTDTRHAIYNLAAFEVVVATRDVDGGTWSVIAADRDGERAVLLARTENQEDADEIVQHIANRLTALDLKPQ
jgi:hypothetical protein